MVTPATVALELGVSQKRVRAALRETFGTLPPDVTRWDLDDATVDLLRERFARTLGTREWALQPGDTVKRRQVHAAYGGQMQQGISTPAGSRNILVFTDPVKGKRYGYDRYEGLREDGSYAYTGEGRRGNQQFTRGNHALSEATAQGKIIRLFRTQGVMATYVGAFETGDPAFEWQTIPDEDHNPRQGIIFNLLPLNARTDLLPAFGGELPPHSALSNGIQPTTWRPPEYSDIPLGASQATGDRWISRAEFKLQSEFGEWLTLNGSRPSRITLRAGSTLIEPDFYVDSRSWIVEAKRSTARGYVRMAIGQVLDYVHVARMQGLEARPVILLPGLPERDLVDLMRSLGVTLVYQDEDEFVEVPAP